MTTPQHYQNSFSTAAGSSSSSSSSTGARAREEGKQKVSQKTRATSSTGACAREEGKIRAFNDCIRYYEDNFRRHPPMAIQKDIAYRIADGMTAEVICAAIDDTQRAPSPSWAYCLAILRRCDREGIKTIQDWNASKDSFVVRRGKPVDDLSWVPFFGERTLE